MDFKMKNGLATALFTVLLTFPLLASANKMEVFESEYLNLGNSVEQGDALNIRLDKSIEKRSDLNQWGNNWGNKIPFKANVPHDVVAYGIEINNYFPKF